MDFLSKGFIINIMEEKKILKAIANLSTTLRTEIIKNREKSDKDKEELKGLIERVEKKLTKRLDMIGKSVAYLEDDTPTREEFEELQKEVETIKSMLKA